MIDDRTAEHVPGCNMAFYTWAAQTGQRLRLAIPQGRRRCRCHLALQDLGYSIGFAPAAQVWHYRRNTVKAYLKQQRGYGEAEALLKYKHPDHFNTLGASHWRGKIYGADQTSASSIGGDVIYHGLFGTGLFQTIYRQPASMLVMMMMSIEWHLLAGVRHHAGPGVSAAALGRGADVPRADRSLGNRRRIQAPRPKHQTLALAPLIAFCITASRSSRGWARYSVRLKNKVMVMRKEARGYRREAASVRSQ
jgi:hypothetical protein